MNVDGELIAAIIKAKPDDCSLETWIASQISEIQQIQKNILSWRQEFKTIEVEMEKKNIAVNKAIADIQNVCPHYKIIKHRDYDSSHSECAICGKEM